MSLEVIQSLATPSELPTQTFEPESRAPIQTAPSGRLPRTPSPHPRESVLGYSLRLTETNGYTTPGYFLAPGSEQVSITRRRLANCLQEAAGLTPDQIARMKHDEEGADGDYGRLLGQRVSLYDLNLKNPRICVQCLQTHGHAEALWEMAWVWACPEHGCKLINRCPECNDVLYWTRRGLLRCKKGHDLAQAPVVAASSEQIRLAAMLSHKLHVGCEDYPGSRTPRHDRTGDLSLYEVGRIAAKLANHVTRQLRVGIKHYRGRVKLAEREDVTQAIADLLCGSSEEMRCLFDRLSVDPTSGDRHRSFHAAFHWLLELLPKDRAAGAMPELLQALFSYASEHWPDGRLQRTSTHFTGFVEDSKWLSVTAAARLIGITETKLKEAIARGEVTGKKVSSKTNHNHIVSLQWAQAAAAIPTVRLGKMEVRRRTGLSPSLIAALRDRGLYVPSIKTKSSWIIEYDLDAFAARLLVAPVAQVTVPTAEHVSLDTLMHRKGSIVSRVSFIESLLDGTIRPCAQVRGTGCLLFDRTEGVVQLLRREQEVSLHEASIILGSDGLKCLVNAGHLTVSAIANRITYVTVKSILAFDRAYVSVRGVLEAADIQILTLLRIARMAKIELLSAGDHLREGLRWFIPRDRLEELCEAIPKFIDVYPPLKRDRVKGQVEPRKRATGRSGS